MDLRLEKRANRYLNVVLYVRRANMPYWYVFDFVSFNLKNKQGSHFTGWHSLADLTFEHVMGL